MEFQKVIAQTKPTWPNHLLLPTLPLDGSS